MCSRLIPRIALLAMRSNAAFSCSLFEMVFLIFSTPPLDRANLKQPFASVR